MEHFIAELSWLVVTYIFGSIPFGLIVAKTCKGIDPRLIGSYNTGATNIARTCGTRYGILTFILDMAKGYFPMLIAIAISGSALFLTLTALAAILGHMYSIFLNRKGGKGVATTIGALAAIIPGPLLLSVILCLILIWSSGYMSLGSLTMVTVLPLFVILCGQFSYLILSLIILFLIYNKHKDNILRLAKGEESPWKTKCSSN